MTQEGRDFLWCHRSVYTLKQLYKFEQQKGTDIPIAPSLYSLSDKMGNSLLAVRVINHKYIVVERKSMIWNTKEPKQSRQNV